MKSDLKPYFPLTMIGETGKDRQAIKMRYQTITFYGLIRLVEY